MFCFGLRGSALRTFLLVVCLLAAAPTASAQSNLTLAWDPTPETPEMDVAGYLLSWGTQPGKSGTVLDVGNTTEWTLTGLDARQRVLLHRAGLQCERGSLTPFLACQQRRHQDPDRRPG